MAGYLAAKESGTDQALSRIKSFTVAFKEQQTAEGIFNQSEIGFEIHLEDQKLTLLHVPINHKLSPVSVLKNCLKLGQTEDLA